MLSNQLNIDKQINTYFIFDSIEETKKCFDVIYGIEISNKIKNKMLGHEIIIFKYNKD